ncbi:MAG: tRNA 2-thiouridine(34) synthase MnmA [Firmicutes bacterium]|nr:tRNA 2-thiouridine(34) synthase MnmA [Bacillota bacterium]
MDLQRPGLQPGTKIMVALSGGVDSFVAALLLQEAGFRLTGATLRLWVDPVAEKKVFAKDSGYYLQKIVAEAKEAARALDIPHHVFDMKEVFCEKVVSYFVHEYSQGRTPNPCIVCNRYLKFSLLSREAQARGIGFLATGHYARIAYDSENNRYRLFRGIDPQKDQSYMLYTLGQEQLSSTIFPLGGYTKEEVRNLAQNRGFNIAEKTESQEICFIPDNDYRSFLQREKAEFTPGDIVSTSGEKMGRHKGLAFYTIGQRKGLGLTSPHPLYVTDIDPQQNVLIVGGKEETYSKGLEAGALNFISGQPPHAPLDVKVKIRYRSPLVPATFYPPDDNSVANKPNDFSEKTSDFCRANAFPAKVFFKEKQKAVTPGQSVVFYQKEELIGGGVIISSLK